MSKQIHIFATCSDLEPGLRHFESEMEVKYVRCDLYYGPTYDQQLSLSDWKDLGKNTTGSHINGPRFLIVPRNCEIEVEPVPQVIGETPFRRRRLSEQNVSVVEGAGAVSQTPVSLNQYLASLEETGVSKEPATSVRYDVSQKLNKDSITFLPGGIYSGERVLVCGHVGKISTSAVAQDLYKRFVKEVTKGFEEIGSYHVGPEAIRLMDEGYRMVTISISSPIEYDLRRSD